MKRIFCALASFALLTACGQTAAEPGTAAAAGNTEMATDPLYKGQGYSIHVPGEGWRLEQDVEDGVSEDIWESTRYDDVEFRISRYGNVSEQEARQRFGENQDYFFDTLEGGAFGKPLTGTDRERDVLRFMSAKGKENVYILSWEYPAQLADSAGMTMENILNTFETTD